MELCVSPKHVTIDQRIVDADEMKVTADLDYICPLYQVNL